MGKVISRYFQINQKNDILELELLHLMSEKCIKKLQKFSGIK